MRRRFLTLSAAMLLLAACAEGSSGSDADGAVTSAPAVSRAAETNAPSALQLSAPLVGGGTIDLTQYVGTTVALWFWAPT